MYENVPGTKYLSATTWGDFAPVLQGHFGFAPRNIFFLFEKKNDYGTRELF